MISSILMTIILSIFLIGVGCNLLYVTMNAFKEKDKYLIPLGITLNIVYWLTIIMLVLKYYGL